MKFTDTNGREHKIDVRPSRWKKKESGEGRGKFQSAVGVILERVFSGDIVLEEFPCVGEGLYLDFFLPRSRLAVEVQGDQHYKFNSFFHRSKADFIAQQNRDGKKEEWCKLNQIKLVKIKWGASEENIIKALS